MVVIDSVLSGLVRVFDVPVNWWMDRQRAHAEQAAAAILARAACASQECRWCVEHLEDCRG